MAHRIQCAAHDVETDVAEPYLERLDGDRRKVAPIDVPPPTGERHPPSGLTPPK